MTTIIASVDPVSSRVDARTADDHAITMDADPPGGDGAVPGPKETLLASLAGCTSLDVVSILRKKRQPPETYDIEISAESAEEHPKVFISITVEHRVGGGVDAKALCRAIELSATRYCPISAMLSAVATIEHRYRLRSADGSIAAGRVVVTGPSGARGPGER